MFESPLRKAVLSRNFKNCKFLLAELVWGQKKMLEVVGEAFDCVQADSLSELIWSFVHVDTTQFDLNELYHGISLCMHATKSNCTEIVQLLLTAGADVNLKCTSKTIFFLLLFLGIKF